SDVDLSLLGSYCEEALGRDNNFITSLKLTHDHLDLFPHHVTFGVAQLLEEWAHLWKGIPSVLHRCGKRREPLGACNGFYGHLTKAGSLEGAAKRGRITQGEHSRIFEGRGRQSSVTTSNCQRLADVRKLLCGREDDGGKSATWLQRALYSCQRLVPL